jgi:microcystin-dependent protein
MVDCYAGEIRMFAGNYAPEGWALCDGALLDVNQYQLLFALLGTTWGGNGTTTFAVPDFRGRIPIGQGTGTGLSPRTFGQTGGTETVVLTEANLPAHNHLMPASTTPGTSNIPGPTVGLAATGGSNTSYVQTLPSPPLPRLLDDTAIGQTGGGGAHANVMPSFTVNYIIAVQGYFPQHQ